MLSWCQSGIAELPRKVFRFSRIMSDASPLFAHYVGKFSSEIDVRGGQMTAKRCMQMLLVLIFACESVACAGSMYEVKCEDDKCGFQTSISVGGGWDFAQVQGYCKNCRKSVALEWLRGNDAKAPKPIAEFWDPATGQLRRLYACPKCREPFAAFKDVKDFRYCPKCGQPTLKHKCTLCYD